MIPCKHGSCQQKPQFLVCCLYDYCTYEYIFLEFVSLLRLFDFFLLYKKGGDIENENGQILKDGNKKC